MKLRKLFFLFRIHFLNYFSSSFLLPSRMPSQGEASLLEQIQARSKDRVYAEEVDKCLLMILRLFNSPTTISRNLASIQRWSSLLYRLLTTFGHVFSLGQEQCSIAPVDADNQRPVSFTLRCVSELTQAFGDIWLSSLAHFFSRHYGRSVISTIVVEALRWMTEGLTVARRNVFDIHGIVCVELLHWILGIKHTRVGTKKGSRASRLTSFLFLLGLLLRINRQLRSCSLYKMLTRSPTKVGKEKAEPQPDCAMCRSPRKDATLAPCGHVFCWECAAHWFSTHAQCPHCRTKASPHSLIVLMNYR